MDFSRKDSRMQVKDLFLFRSVSKVVERKGYCAADKVFRTIGAYNDIATRFQKQSDCDWCSTDVFRNFVQSGVTKL